MAVVTDEDPSAVTAIHPWCSGSSAVHSDPPEQFPTVSLLSLNRFLIFDHAYLAIDFQDGIAHLSDIFNAVLAQIR